MKNTVRIGILYSTTGPYGGMGLDGRDGAELAIEDARGAAHGAATVSYTHLTLPTNREV